MARALQEMSQEQVDYAELEKVYVVLEDGVDLFEAQRARGLDYTRRQVGHFEEVTVSKDLSVLRLFLHDRAGGRDPMWSDVWEAGLRECL